MDIIFPKKCLICEKEGTFLCLNCLDKIALKLEQVCPYCEQAITPQGKPCRRCQLSKTVVHLDHLVASCLYEEPLKKIIHRFKYNFVEELGKPLSQLLFQSFLKNNLDLPDLIVPVPLHQLRKRWRGFNQAEVLAENLAQLLAPGIGIEIFQGLRRTRFTNPQMKIKNYQKRRQNLEEAFSLENKNEIRGRHILLIDDIATSGTTIFECTKVLRKSGAKYISALILARQQC